MDERPWHIHRILGRSVRVHDDLGTALTIQELLDDPVLDGREKGACVLQLLFVNPQGFVDAFQDRLQEALDEVLAQVFGAHEKGAGAKGRPFDWKYDLKRIQATVRSAYNLSFEELKAIPYTEACTLMALAPEESPLGQAIYYRMAKRPKATKYNREQIESFDRLKKFYALPEDTSADSIEAKNAAASAAFARLAGRR